MSIYNKKTNEGLRAWFNTINKNPKTGLKFKGWVNCEDGTPCGADKAGKKRLCRPTKSDCPSKEKLNKLKLKKTMGKSVDWD